MYVLPIKGTPVITNTFFHSLGITWYQGFTGTFNKFLIFITYKFI